MITIKTLLQQAKIQGIDSLDAEVLLAHALQKDRAYLHTWPNEIATDEQAKLYQHSLARRVQGEPIAYIVGSKEFWSLPLQVTPDTLIPRADSECWIHWLLERYAHADRLSVLDLGTGSGAIALALAHEKPLWSICAVDFSAAALAVAKQNAHNLALKIEWVQSDWYHALSQRRFDLIVANPPYIAEEEPHWQQGDLCFEPKTALVAKDHGLSDLQQIIQQAPHHLSAKGLLLVEHGYRQGAAVQALFMAAGFKQVQTHCDYGGQPRWTVGVINV